MQNLKLGEAVTDEAFKVAKLGESGVIKQPSVVNKAWVVNNDNPFSVLSENIE
jgi:hypothetical protein